MDKEFHQCQWDERLEADWKALLRLAADEDLGAMGDLTTRALVADDVLGKAAVVARTSGVLAGARAVPSTLDFSDPGLEWRPVLRDGQPFAPGDTVGRIEGPAAALLTAERPLLNLLGRLSGIATLAGQYVDAVRGTRAKVYDTRKTTPGWRRLEKYAVRCGGGANHRSGLDGAVLIKDNHLALTAPTVTDASFGETPATYEPAQAVKRAREFIEVHVPRALQAAMIVEIEVDTLDQLEAVLPVRPDIVLLDNMTPDQLREAVALRDRLVPEVELEASGRINLDTVRAAAEAGVERISVGAMTHSAVWLDFGLDWLTI